VKTALLTICTLGVFLSLGCGAKLMNTIPEPTGGGGNVFDSENKGTPTTDLSECNNGFKATTPVGKWKMTFDQDGVELTSRFDIRQTATTITNTCKYKDQSVQAIASITSAIFPARHEVFFNDSAEDTAEGTDGFKCNVTVKSEILFFEFDNACLRVRPASQKKFFTLIPYEKALVQ
jgi:hypothetical protein